MYSGWSLGSWTTRHDQHHNLTLSYIYCVYILIVICNTLLLV